MPTGADIARAALRRAGILSFEEEGDAAEIADALSVISDLLDAWRTDHLTISGITRTAYSLVTNTQSYTIGSGGTFNQEFPSDIKRWSVIPDGGAASPVEIPRGRPLEWEEWQRIPVKSQTGDYPSKLWFDSRQDAGLGRILVWPIPDSNSPDIVLYNEVAALTALVHATSYTLPIGVKRALVLNGALELSLSGAYEVPDKTIQKLAAVAPQALADVKRQHYRPTPISPIRPEFARLGRRGKRFDIRVNE